MGNSNRTAHSRNKYADYIDTGGFSKRMIYAYIFLLSGTVIFVWFFASFKLSLSILLFLVSLPLLFFYRFCHYAMKVFGSFNTPLIWHKQSTRILTFSLASFFLGGSIFLSYSIIDSFIIVACGLLSTFWLINWLAKHHIQVTVTAMAEQVNSPTSDKEKLIDLPNNYSATKEQLDDVLLTLTEREEKVIRLRWGIGDGHIRTPEEVGEIFNTTAAKVSQIEAKALRKLRHPTRAARLKKFAIPRLDPEGS